MQGEQVDEQLVERRPGRVVPVDVQHDNAMQAGPQQQSSTLLSVAVIRGSLSFASPRSRADVELTDPDVVYDGQAEIDLGGHRAVLRSWGPAHTAGDQTILVDGRVLFGGDLFETRMFPIVPYFPPADTDVDGSRWITVLDQLLALDPAVVVPGHGEITDVSLIRDVRDYLDYVRSQAGRLRASGASAADAAAAIEQDARARWDNWANPEWIGYAACAFHQASPSAARVSA
jgi:glyoxylase-like metal-dependent hydrolase (beta-lactamase superfamily II)